MDVFQQLEAMRKRILQEIYTEFDAFAECLREQMSEGIDPCAYALPYDMQYPLTAGAGIFKGKKQVSPSLASFSPSRRLFFRLFLLAEQKKEAF